MQAEQGLAAAALHVADLRKEVNQKQAELRAAERERQVAAALAGQLPRLQRWQSMQVMHAVPACLQPGKRARAETKARRKGEIGQCPKNTTGKRGEYKREQEKWLIRHTCGKNPASNRRSG